MNVVGRVSSIITAGVYSVATPFHPFGGAVDIIAVKQQDGSFRCTPWYVRFGKFQGVLKGSEKVVRIQVNGVEADFHMYLDNSGEAYFVREVDADKESESNGGLIVSDEGSHRHETNESIDSELERQEERVGSGVALLDRTESGLYEFYDVQSSLEDSINLSEYGSSHYENLDAVEHILESQSSSPEVVLVSVDGHILTAPISSSDNTENVELSMPRFHLGPGESADFRKGNAKFSTGKAKRATDCSGVTETSVPSVGFENRDTKFHRNDSLESTSSDIKNEDVFKSCLELSELALEIGNKPNQKDTLSSFGGSEEMSHLSPLTIKETEDRSNKFGHDNMLPPGSDPSSCYPLPSVLVEVENLVESTSKIDLTDSDTPQIEGSDKCVQSENLEPHARDSVADAHGLEISRCGNLLHPGMGSSEAAEVFKANRISEEEYKSDAESIIKNKDLVVRIRGKYLPWERAASIVLGMAAYNLELPIESTDVIRVERDEGPRTREDDSGFSGTPSGRRWRLWPNPFRRVKSLEHRSSNSTTEDASVDSECTLQNQGVEVEPNATPQGGKESSHKQFVRTNIPTSDEIASLNLKEGQNTVSFIFSTRVLGEQKVEAHMYLWKWNARIVISDVDGTITKSDVLGQFMPLVGKDWTHSGIARLYSAIKENGYQLLFLSARAIVQAYLTRSFLFNLKQDGQTLPNGPVVISPDGLFPSLYREVIKRAPHEFKIACLQDIKALFPPDYNPFYAGFGNRDTDELSYRRIGIPKGKIFIINPKGEVAISHRLDVKSYTSLHTLVNDMFPPTSMIGQEDFNDWNHWKMPLPEINGSL
ncbi:PREDICTED: phosphatidate phosphatase PAH1-like isoform X3 [Ipomoea nil]|uniref:phosphatidate phosphatase PAH1-like isoform X3 n=1 Tax=Ipomoea nil TaxID=35883 RepID=UPI000901E39F|nr:PREDICTED: phosphatidate phosphatase PAH1-like isoform X3 [Ipomoea nil]